MTFPKIFMFFDDVEIGQEWESLGRTVTETDIVAYAGLSGDFNPIHMDHEFAKTTVYRKPIAHGLLIWAISSGLGMLSPPMRTLAFVGIRDWQFKSPVYIGDTIRIKTKVMEKEARARGRRGLITWLRTITNKAGKTVQEGITTTLVEGRALHREARHHREE
jgi:3-hydroxybutyryl-CoA dehydratase